MARAKATAKKAPKKAAKKAAKNVAKNAAKNVAKNAATNATTPASGRGTLLDLCKGLEVRRRAAVPPERALPDGRRIVAWARLGGSSDERPWLARLGASGDRLQRAFSKRTTSTNAGYATSDDGVFLMTAFWTEDHPLTAGVYEACGRVESGPPNYHGRATFEVTGDGAIEIVGTDRDSPSPETVRELLRRIAAHDARDGGAASARAAREQAERAGETDVRSDELTERFDLPVLQGSERQVRWAMDIRRKAIETLLRNTGCDVYVGAARTQTSARWWIDHRDTATRDLIDITIGRT